MSSIADDAIPNPRQIYDPKVTCQPGSWRVNARAYGMFSGAPFDFSDHRIERKGIQEECDGMPR